MDCHTDKTCWEILAWCVFSCLFPFGASRKAAQSCDMPSDMPLCAQSYWAPKAANLRQTRLLRRGGCGGGRGGASQAVSVRSSSLWFLTRDSFSHRTPTPLLQFVISFWAFHFWKDLWILNKALYFAFWSRVSCTYIFGPNFKGGGGESFLLMF